MSEEAGTSFDPRIVLRPRSLDETFDLSIAYLRESLPAFLRLFVPFTIVLSAAIITLSELFDWNLGQQAAAVVVVAPLYERVVTVFSGRHLFQNPMSPLAACRAVLKRLPFLFVHALFMVLPALLILLTDIDEPVSGVIGSFLAIAWVLFILPAYLHLTEVMMLEQLSAGRAMKRARVLLAYRFGRALGFLFFSLVVRALIVAMVYFGLTFLLSFVLQFESVATNIGPYFAIVGYLVAAPYIAVARLFDYVDTRTRREGWDIQVRFNAIAQRAVREEKERLAA